MMMMFQLSLFLLVLITFSNGEDKNYAKICNAKWNPNFSGELEKCDKGCGKGFECLNDYCCPTKDVVCEQAADSGNELKDFEHDGRFYYDKELKNCLKFSFFGASESFNNFLKYSDCKRFCADV